MRFFTTTVEKKWLLERIRTEPSLGVALCRLSEDEREIDEYAKKQLQERPDDFLTVQVLGAQGIGKSGVGQKLAQKYSSLYGPGPLVVDNITLQYPPFFDIVERLQRGEWAILDEQTKLHGTGSMRLKDDIVNIVETLRKSGGCMCFIAPTEKSLNSSDIHLTIEVLGRTKDTCLCAYKARGDTFLGAFLLRLNWKDALWEAYEEKKDAYLQQAKARAFFKNDYEALAAEIETHPDAAFCTKRKHWALLLEKTNTNLTVEEKKLVLAELEMRKKKGLSAT